MSNGATERETDDLTLREVVTTFTRTYDTLHTLVQRTHADLKDHHDESRISRQKLADQISQMREIVDAHQRRIDRQLDIAYKELDEVREELRQLRTEALTRLGDHDKRIAHLEDQERMGSQP